MRSALETGHAGLLRETVPALRSPTARALLSSPSMSLSAPCLPPFSFLLSLPPSLFLLFFPHSLSGLRAPHGARQGALFLEGISSCSMACAQGTEPPCRGQSLRLFRENFLQERESMSLPGDACLGQPFASSKYPTWACCSSIMLIIMN